MLNNKFTSFGKAVLEKAASKSPILCAIGGVVLTGGALYMMNRQTKKREEILDKYIQTKRQKICDKAVKLGEDVTIDEVVVKKEDFTFRDKVVVGIKTYGIPVCMYLAGVGLSVTGVALLSKRLAAAAISPVATTAIGCTNEVIADRAKKEIDEKLHGPDAEKYRPKVQSGCGIGYTNGGHDIFYNTWDKSWFFSDINTVKNAVLQCSEALSRDEEVTRVLVNDFYDTLGATRSVGGDHEGWLAGSPIDVDYEIRTFEDGTPYTAIIWKTEPETII